MSVHIRGPHERRLIREHGIVHSIIMVLVVLWALPVAMAIIGVDSALWSRVIQDLERGQYFGQFHLAGQPFDVILEALYLVLLALPLLLPAAWILNRLRKFVMKPRHRDASASQ